MMGAEEPTQSERRTASDMEVAKFFIGHINNPCEVNIGEGGIENIRKFYIREAERILPTFTDPKATSQLKENIDKYSPPNEK